MEGVDIDALFDVARQLQECEGVEASDATGGEASDATGGVVMRTLDGSFHVCTGISCPYAVQDKDSEKHWMCSLTGKLISTCVESSHDASWTGRSCSSADPDMHSGAVKPRAWKTKRDAFTDSARAYSQHQSISIDEPVFEGASVAAPSDAVVKRGAPSILEIDEQAVERQRAQKASKRALTLDSSNVRARLLGEASTVARRLLSTLEGVTVAVEAIAKVGDQDPRLTDYDYVLQVGLQRYVQRCIKERCAVHLNTIHDVCIRANAFVKKRRKQAAMRERIGKIKKIAMDGRTIELCASLIVAIWNAVCISSYFLRHQAGDSFKPFSAGVLYAFKRGLWLQNGVLIIPQLTDLSDQLPVLRSSIATQQAKQLQASSHKGLCALHKAISSVGSMEDDARQRVLDRFSVASRIANELKVHATLP